jgi:hypothetical protein
MAHDKAKSYGLDQYAARLANLAAIAIPTVPPADLAMKSIDFRIVNDQTSTQLLVEWSPPDRVENTLEIGIAEMRRMMRVGHMPPFPEVGHGTPAAE